MPGFKGLIWKIFAARSGPDGRKPDVMRSRSRSVLDTQMRVTMRYVRAVETSKRVAVEGCD
jgi:hypothetical protein